MLRFFYIIGILTKYAFLLLLVKLRLYKIKNETFLKKFFEDAGGSFIKFGQLLALRVDVLPKEYSLEMLDLLDNVKPFPYHFVTEIFLQDLGATPEKIFKDFQKEPFASGSFGQVHAAKFENNTIVAVKILRPGIEEMVAVDFFIIDILTFFGDLFYKIDALPWKEFASEFKKWTRKEIDYHIEAENADRMYQNYKDVDTVVIPKTYHQLSTKRILVQEYIDGIHLNRVLRGLRDGRLTPERLLKMGIDIKETPRTMTREILRQYFFFGFFHADLHPGNIILLPHNRIAFIDFGITGEWLQTNQSSMIKLMKSVGDFNFKKATYYMSDLVNDDLRQLIQSAFPANIDQKKIDDFMRIIADHFSETVEKTVKGMIPDLRAMKKDYTILLLQLVRSAEHYKIRLPKEMVIFIKALSTLGILAKEMDYNYLISSEIKRFFAEHPEESFPVTRASLPMKRMSRERALERMNNWLSYLVEVDPAIYKLVNSYITKYNLVDK